MIRDVPRGRPPKPMPDDGLAEPLRELSQRLQMMHAEVRELEQARTELIRAARDAGWTHAQIAEVSGLSPGRIAQLQ